MNVPEEQQNTITWVVNSLDPEVELLTIAGQMLCEGRLVAFPTETVYGLGANAFDSNAVFRIFTAKGRPSHNPLIVHVVGKPMRDLVVAAWPEIAERLAARFWPGPLTMVLPKTEHIPPVVTGGGPTVAIREPANRIARGLISAAKVPLAAPSANRSNELSPTLASHVVEGLNGRIAGIIDGGPCTAGIESTVIDLTQQPPRILRPGPISQAAIEEIIGPVDFGGGHLATDALPSPGMLLKHYSPQTPTVLISARKMPEIQPNWAVVGFGNDMGTRGLWVRMPTEPAEYAQRLYAVLHELDQKQLEKILIIAPPETAEWVAVRDRLTRATYQD